MRAHHLRNGVSLTAPLNSPSRPFPRVEPTSSTEIVLSEVTIVDQIHQHAYLGGEPI